MRLLIIPDVHLSDRPPSIRRDGYVDQILAKLEFAVNTAAQLNCDAVVQAGDLFHVKAPSRTSHELVMKTAEVLGDMAADLKVPVYVVPGNHDVQNDRLESLPGQPLGTLSLHPNIHLLIGKHDDLPVFGLPHLQYWSTQLRRWVQDSKGSALTVAHAPLFPTGSHPPYEFISAEDWASLGGAQRVYTGHVHDNQGIYRGEDTWFANHGALSRGSLHEGTLRRKPAVTLFDSDFSGTFDSAMESAGSGSGQGTRTGTGSSGTGRDTSGRTGMSSLGNSGDPSGADFTLATLATGRGASDRSISGRDQRETTSRTNSRRDATDTPREEHARTGTSSTRRTRTSVETGGGARAGSVSENGLVWYAGFARIEVPHLPADQVFALREKAVVENRQTDIDEFLTRVEETSLYGLSLEEVLRKAEADDLPPRALQVVREVLEEAAHG